MGLPRAVELSIHCLTRARSLLWAESGIGRPPGRRAPLARAAQNAAVQGLGAAHPRLPIEELGHLRALPPTSRVALEALGAPGDALACLALRYFDCIDGWPVPRDEHLLELQEVRLQVVADQIACFRLALALHAAGAFPPPRVRVDWPDGFAPADPRLVRVLNTPAVDGHVHLGGVATTLDLWHDALAADRRQRHRRVLYQARDRLGAPVLPDTVRSRLNDVRGLRDLLTLTLARARVDGIGAGPASASDALTAHLIAAALESLGTQVALEEALVADICAPSPTAGDVFTPRSAVPGTLSREFTRLAFVRSALVPYGVSPWLAEKQREALEGHIRRERRLLLAAFAHALGVYGAPPPYFGPALLIYVICQNLFHRSVTQYNKRVGFENFLDSYESPTRWFRDTDDGTIRERVLHRATEGFRTRLEGRVTPKPTTVRRWLDTCRRAARQHGVRLGHDVGLIAHFIKLPERPCPPFEATDIVRNPPFLLRFCALRRSLRAEAFALEELRRTNAAAAVGVLGIDAARTETDTPPEVFGPVFRYLRRCSAPHGTAEPRGSATAAHRSRLRATYHVGESFHHPVSGLRSVHEALEFLALRAGDRIGHATVIGIDAARWLQESGRSPHLTLDERLMNLVWCAHVRRVSGVPRTRLDDELQRAVALDFERLYLREVVPATHTLIDLLFDAWRLRWMSPTDLDDVLRALGWRQGRPPAADGRDAESGGVRPCWPVDVAGNVLPCRVIGRCQVRRGRRGSPAERLVCAAGARDDWSRCTAVAPASISPVGLQWRLHVLDVAALLQGEVPVAAVRYLWRHHFDRGVRRRGEERVEWPAALAAFEGVEFDVLREFVVAEVARRGVVVEACPTSNRHIGAFAALSEHPIFTLNGPAVQGVPATARTATMVCTDDAGIFATTLSNEYALLHRAARDVPGVTRHDADAWILRLRAESCDASFLAPDAPDGPERRATALAEATVDHWPPAMAHHPEWRNTAWRALALGEAAAATSARLRERLRQTLWPAP